MITVVGVVSVVGEVSSLIRPPVSWFHDKIGLEPIVLLNMLGNPEGIMMSVN